MRILVASALVLFAENDRIDDSTVALFNILQAALGQKPERFSGHVDKFLKHKFTSVIKKYSDGTARQRRVSDGQSLRKYARSKNIIKGLLENRSPEGPGNFLAPRRGLEPRT